MQLSKISDKKTTGRTTSTTSTTSGQTDTKSEQTNTTGGQTVLRVNRQAL